jgi:hypothetical protein
LVQDTSTAGGDMAAAVAWFKDRMADAPISASAAGADEEVTSSATRIGPRDMRLYGANKQPEWTTERPFATTRAYVLAPNQIEVEQWVRTRLPRGEAPDHSLQTEVGFGLPGRFQVDLYELWGHHGHNAPTKHDGVAVEGRYALGEWGRIMFNPTLYLEYTQLHRAPDHVEGKILLAENFCDWRWAGNLSYDQQMGGLRATEIALSTGLSHPIIDSQLSAGAEAKYSRVTGIGFRADEDAINELLLGPTLQWRPINNMHVDFAPLFGLTHGDRRDPRLEVYLIVGFDFGPTRDRRGGADLVSDRHR